MIYLTLMVMCLAFIELFFAMRLRHQIVSILSISKQSLAILASSTASDDEKEQFVRRQSLQLMLQTALFAGKFTIIVLTLYALFAIAATLFAISTEEFLESTLSLATIVAATIGALIYAKVRYAFFQKL